MTCLWHLIPPNNFTLFPTVPGMWSQITTLISFFHSFVVSWGGRKISDKGVKPGRRSILRGWFKEEPTTTAQLLQFHPLYSGPEKALQTLLAFFKYCLTWLSKHIKQLVSEKSWSGNPIKIFEVGWTNRILISSKTADFHSFIEQLFHIGIQSSASFSMSPRTHTGPFFFKIGTSIWKGKWSSCISVRAFFFHTTSMVPIMKEGFSIMAAIKRKHCPVSTPLGSDLDAEYNNLVFTFNPLSLASDLSDKLVCKALKWAVHLSGYNYFCFHIPGMDSMWADLISHQTYTPVIQGISTVLVLPASDDPEFQWPLHDQILLAQ